MLIPADRTFAFTSKVSLKDSKWRYRSRELPFYNCTHDNSGERFRKAATHTCGRRAKLCTGP